MTRFLKALFAVSIALTAATAHAGEPAREILAHMRAAVRGLDTYEVVIASHQVKGGRTDDITIRMAWQAPGRLRTDVLEGRNHGAVAIYDPGTGRLRAKMRGTPVVGMSPDAKMARSLRGERIYEAAFDHLLKRADRYVASGSVTFEGEATVGGKPCQIVSFTLTTPSDHRDVATERWSVDKKTWLPVAIEQRDAKGQELATARYSALVLNPRFPADLFTPALGDDR